MIGVNNKTEPHGEFKLNILLETFPVALHPLVLLGSFSKVEKIQVMGFNKQNITLHVYGDARFTVGFLLPSLHDYDITFLDGKFFLWT